MRKFTTAILAIFLLPFFGASVTAQLKHEEFRSKYQSARQLNDAKAMAKILKKYPTECIWYFEERADQAIHRNDLKAADEVEKLKGEFKAAWDSDVLGNVERFRRGLDPQGIARISKITGQETVAWNIYLEAKKSNSDADYRRAIEGMQKVAEALAQTGDKLKSAASYALLASIINRYPKKTMEDRTLALEAMNNYVQNHQDWDWTKSMEYAQNAAFAKGLKASLDNAKSGDGGKVAGVPGDGGSGNSGGLIKYKEGSKWLTSELGYKVQKRSVEGISLYASANPLNWLGFFMDGTNPVQMKFFKDGDIYVQRGGAAKFTNPIGGNPDPKAKSVKLAGAKKSSDLWYERMDSDGEKYDTNYGFFMWTGGNQEQYANVTLNMAPQWRPDRKTASVYVKSAAYFTAKIAGVDVTLYDENCNGVFGDKPGSLAYNTFMFGGGMEEPMRHEIFDSMKVGKGKLVPYSPMVKLGADWYLLKIIRNNEEIRYRPLADVKTGTIKVLWKGSKSAKPRHLCIRETSGAWPDAMFDVMAGGSKGIEVPAGKYEVFYGRAYNGKPPRSMDAVILKGDSKTIEVKEGAVTTMDLGAPFQIDFTLEREGETLIADSTMMWVRDKFGLRYTSLQCEMLEPDFVVAKDEKGKGSKTLGSWRRVADGDLNALSKKFAERSGLVLASFAIDKKSGGSPSFRIKAKNPLGTAKSFVGVQQKKHRMFGKLLPVWK